MYECIFSCQLSVSVVAPRWFKHQIKAYLENHSLAWLAWLVSLENFPALDSCVSPIWGECGAGYFWCVVALEWQEHNISAQTRRCEFLVGFCSCCTHLREERPPCVALVPLNELNVMTRCLEVAGYTMGFAN